MLTLFLDLRRTSCLGYLKICPVILVCWVVDAFHRPLQISEISSRRNTICHPSPIIPAPAPDLVLPCPCSSYPGLVQDWDAWAHPPDRALPLARPTRQVEILPGFVFSTPLTHKADLVNQAPGINPHP